jgi:hypothetical protein
MITITFMLLCKFTCGYDQIRFTLSSSIIRLPNYILSLDYFILDILYLYNNCDITFLTVFSVVYPNPPCQSNLDQLKYATLISYFSKEVPRSLRTPTYPTYFCS